MKQLKYLHKTETELGYFLSNKSPRSEGIPLKLL